MPAEVAQKPLLEIQGLRILFSGTPAVDGIDLTIPRGSFTALVGESGSGKSATALSIARLSSGAQVSGRFLWHVAGEKTIDLSELTESRLRMMRGSQIGYVFQDPASSLNPVLRIGKQLAEAYHAHFPGSPESVKSLAVQALASVKLMDADRIWRAYPHELSGGMRQRVLIAMNLLLNPRLLIADEPTTALDATIEREILGLLFETKKAKGFSVLFITHDIQLASRYADAIHVMKNGRLIEKIERVAGVWHPCEEYSKNLFHGSLLSAPPKTRLEIAG